jgi:hypothetical protein
MNILRGMEHETGKQRNVSLAMQTEIGGTGKTTHNPLVIAGRSGEIKTKIIAAR